MELKKLFFVHLQAEPYLMKTENGEYIGYTKDVLDRLVSIMKMRYSIYMVPDDQYGYMYAPRKWNGMIKELLDDVSSQMRAIHKVFYGDFHLLSSIFMFIDNYPGVKVKKQNHSRKSVISRSMKCKVNSRLSLYL